MTVVSAGMIVAIDGPSGVGKSTVAQLVAAALGIPYLDTGAMYRCLALQSLRAGLSDSPTEEEVGLLLADFALEMSTRDGRAELLLDGTRVGAEIRTREVSERTSRIAALVAVRQSMLEKQRGFGKRHGGVVEGRDIGTKVFPYTPWKFFLDAEPSVRAERRWRELVASNPTLTLAQVQADLEARDQRDRERSEAPLVRTPSHILIDTGSTDADGVAERIVRFVRAVQARSDERPATDQGPSSPGP